MLIFQYMALFDRQKRNFKMRPALMILLGFACIILVGAFLLCLPISNKDGEWLSFFDALFTATSSVCVTGMQVFDIAVKLSLFGQVVVLFLVQVGGLGVVAATSFLFIMVGKKINYSTRIALQESLSKEDNQGVIATILKILLITLICEVVGFLALLPSMISFTGNAWSGMFKALFLSISAFCNAGIDPLGSATAEFSNLAYFVDKSWVLIPVMILIVLGGIGSIVILDVVERKKQAQRTMLHTRIVLWMTGILILLGAVIFAVAEWNNPETIGNLSVWNKIVNSLFQSITTRTAGFASFDQSGLTQISIIVSEVLMFIGGSPVSMAGGIKTTTLFVFILLLFKGTNQNGNIIYRNKKITHIQITKAVKIVLIAVGVLFIGTIMVFLFEKSEFGFGTVLFECVSAISTAGISLGITPLLSVPSRIVLMLMMYIGRIGMLTIPLAFKTKETTGIEYVEAKLIVG